MDAVVRSCLGTKRAAKRPQGRSTAPQSPRRSTGCDDPSEPGVYTSIAFTDRLVDEGIDPSVGSVGDAYDNSLAESQIGLYKSELIHHEGPWSDVDQVEAATAGLVQWLNTDRTHGSIDDLTPLELEQLDYARTEPSNERADTSKPLSGHAGDSERFQGVQLGQPSSRRNRWSRSASSPPSSSFSVVTAEPSAANVRRRIRIPYSYRDSSANIPSGRNSLTTP
ncbi:integrase core domain-containing protein [Agromyces marinus]|uniref:integrase core domain-containing protein n=1 Tax=Agromyces marinus TaxID=1389020 RepID=UPI001F23CDB3|nr:integrase core domain-containing protein [Agromyces marinus]